MLIGVPREIKPQEFRVGLTPESVAELTHRGHGVLVESGAGAGIGAADDAYRAAGASIVGHAAEFFAAADLIVKVKERQPQERRLLRRDQVLFQPTFVEQGIMPGAVPHTSTYALNNATLPHVLALADKGWRQALRDDPHLRDGLNVCAGLVTHPAVAGALGYPVASADDLLVDP